MRTPSIRRLEVQALAMGARVHARRPLLHGRLRRLVPESPVPDLRLRAAASRTRRRRCVPRSTRMASCEEARLAGSAQRRRRAGAERRRRAGHARRLCRSTRRSRLPAERHAAGRGGPLDLADPRARGSGRAAAAADREDDRRHPVGEGRVAGPGTRAAGTRRSPTAAGRRARSARSSMRAASGSPIFQPHHQPFNYYARFAPGTPDRAEHLKDGDDFVRDIAAGHAARGRVLQAGRPLHAASVVHRHEERRRAHRRHARSACARARSGTTCWSIVTYDENGGYWDHVPPPTGPGLGRPLGPRHAHPDDPRRADGEARLRRPHALRHDLDPEVHHRALRPRAAARRAREDGRSDGRAAALSFRSP